jgi:hypothetical protein
MNGWQRIGVAASALWAIGAGIWDYSLKQHVVDLIDQHCLRPPTQPAGAVDTIYCGDTFYVVVHWQPIVALALVPIPVAWLMVYGIVWIFRRMCAGSRSSR